MSVSINIAPNDLEAERSVIGAMLMDAEAIDVATDMLREEDFYVRQNGVLFSAIWEIHQSGVAVDPVTLLSKLREKNLPPDVFNNSMLLDLINTVPTSANIKFYANIVAEKSLLRKMIRACEEIIGSCYTQEDVLDVIMDQAEKKIFEISQRRQSGDFVSIRQIVLNAVDKIESASHIKGNVTGLSTGFTDLDNKTAGFQNSDLILIAARPSMGKTALALNIAQHVVLKESKCVAIFSLEMSKEQLTTRLFAMESQVNAQSIRTGSLTDQEWADLIESAGIIGESKLIIDDTPAITVQEMRSRCRKYKMEYGLEMIIVDYLQLMSGDRKRSENKQQEIAEISRALKALARELNVPVVALSQLSRAVETRPNHRPILSDLRDSGAIEQDADVVMFIYRDDYYNQNSEKKGIAEIIIAKQRNGPIGTVELTWQPSFTKFANLAN